MTRGAWSAVAFLMLATPLLAFPRALGVEHAWVAVVIGIVALVVSVKLLRGFGAMPVVVALLALLAIAGWVRASAQVDTINHFAGLALGLLAMATIAYVCRSRLLLALAVGSYVLLGAVILGVGLRSATPVYGAKAFSLNPLGDAWARPPLPLNALHARTSVNPNVLGAVAMLILPVAAAVAVVPLGGGRLPLALRLLGVVMALGAGAVVVLTQSRSVWMSAVVVIALLMRRRVAPRVWWVAAGAWCIILALLLTVVDHPQVADALVSAGSRTLLWEDSVQALQSSPWLGIGFDYLRHSGLALVQQAPDRIVGAPHAHNIFLQTALDIGVIGLACYLAIIGLVLRRATDLIRSADDAWVRSVGIGAALSLVSVHVFGLLDAIPLGAKVGLFQWLACGLILAAWRIRTSSEGT